jgi:hypothetical protein
MLGSAAKYGIETQAKEGCDHGQDDNFDNHGAEPVSMLDRATRRDPFA